MLTIFTIPKSFLGHNDVIQRNALGSWTLLRPACEIILFGKDEGTAEVAEEFGVKHIPDIECNEYGTPRIDSMYAVASDAAKNEMLCHINADIILMKDFMQAVEHLSAARKEFLLTGQRWNVDIDGPMDFEGDWEQKLRNHVANHGSLGARTGIDYFVFPRDFWGFIPPFTIGRTAYDQWLLYQARVRGAALIDATPVVMDVHQNHDYSHLAKEHQGTAPDMERRRNLELAGGRKYLFITKDCTEVLTPAGLRPPPLGWRVWRFIRTASALRNSWPFPARMALNALNLGIDTGRASLTAGKFLGRGRAPWSRG